MFEDLRRRSQSVSIFNEVDFKAGMATILAQNLTQSFHPFQSAAHDHNRHPVITLG
jgi:hypothetical protein